MAITERDRRNLFNHLEQALGSEPAENLMELLPSQPADELVTRADMHTFGSGLAAELRGEMADLRGELRSEMAQLRVDLNRMYMRGMAFNVVAVVTALVA